MSSEDGSPLEVLRATNARLLAEGVAPVVEVPTFEVLEERARKLGEDHGRSAASWFFDGNTNAETYARVLEGIEEGDPEVLDTFPGSPLSGEWADGPLPRDILEELGVDDDADSADDLLRAYEDGFASAAADEIERAARYQVSA